MSVDGAPARIASDIGGTFTDIVLELGGRRSSVKVLTRHDHPEIGVLEGMSMLLDRAGIRPGQVDVMVHGTTLATNALIERRGARVVFLTTAGFRDTLEMRTESRFEQYDLRISMPAPLVPRERRFPVVERIDARGRVVTPLDERHLRSLVPEVRATSPDAIALGFLHSYANAAHEERVREILMSELPDVPISISSEVAQEMREYARFSTTCANAYVQPLIASYLSRLAQKLFAGGFACPLLLMLSGGGLTTVEAASRFPVRLVESGPAGGAIFAAETARQCGLEDVLSFDMGGTTAKLCLIAGGHPRQAREFEVARAHRFRKGSGLPLRIPVIEMVEIGAGGGSIANLDPLGRIAVGPESAGSDPGPACYGRGGTRPTVSDANVVLGRIDPASFAGGTMVLDRAAAGRAVHDGIGDALGVNDATAAYGICEIVEENMAAAARLHAIEAGTDVTRHALIAFGGGAPLHAGMIARKLGIGRFIVPPGAGVGSAVGFLRADISYEVARTLVQLLSAIDLEGINETLAMMSSQARSVVTPAALGSPLAESRSAYLRYSGQGHEVSVEVPARSLSRGDTALLRERFERRYRELYTWLVPEAEIEVVTWLVRVHCPTTAEKTQQAATPAPRHPVPCGRRTVFDRQEKSLREIDVFERAVLLPGDRLDGPAIIVEAETSTYVPQGFAAEIDGLGHIDCNYRAPSKTVEDRA